MTYNIPTEQKNTNTEDTITIPESAIKEAAIDLFYKMRDEIYELRKYSENYSSKDEEIINLRLEIQKFQEDNWQQQQEIEKLKEQRKRILQEKEKEIEELKQEIQKFNPTGKFSFKVR